MRKTLWTITFVCFALLLVTGLAFAQADVDYKLNMRMQVEKVEQPVTLYGEIGGSLDGIKAGVRYKMMPNVFVAMHMGFKEERPFDLEVAYRVPTGMDYIRVYGGVGIDLKESALFGGYLIGGIEAAVMYLELTYRTGQDKVTGWGGVRLPIF